MTSGLCKGRRVHTGNEPREDCNGAVQDAMRNLQNHWPAREVRLTQSPIDSCVEGCEGKIEA